MYRPLFTAFVLTTIVAIAVYLFLKQFFVSQNPSLKNRSISAAFWFPIFQLWGPASLFFSLYCFLPTSIEELFTSEAAAEVAITFSEEAINDGLIERNINGVFSIIVTLFTCYTIYGLFNWAEFGNDKLKKIPRFVTWAYVIMTGLTALYNLFISMNSGVYEIAFGAVISLLCCFLYLYFQLRYDKAVDTIFQFGKYREVPKNYVSNQYTVPNQYAVSSVKPIKTCPYCGEEILAVAKKCKHCGEWLNNKLEQPQKEFIACPVCGEQIEKGMTLCPYCKEPVGEHLKQGADEEGIIEPKKVKMLRCPICSELIPFGSEVCPECNERIEV
jgi:predicted nucleic acid-binding Zn ribbon protein